MKCGYAGLLQSVREIKFAELPPPRLKKKKKTPADFTLRLYSTMAPGEESLSQWYLQILSSASYYTTDEERMRRPDSVPVELGMSISEGGGEGRGGEGFPSFFFFSNYNIHPLTINSSS